MAGNSAQQPPKSEVSRRSFLQRTAFLSVASLVPADLVAQNPVGDIYGEGLPACRIGYPTVQPSYAVDGPLLNSFRELSETLTGVNLLDANLAKAYLTRVATNPELTSALPLLVDAFQHIRTKPKTSWENEIAATIMKDSQLRHCAEQV